MNNYNTGDFVDLTNSFTLVDHCALDNIVIDLDTDDSVIEDDATHGNTTSVDISNSNEERLNPSKWTANTQTHSKNNKTCKKNNLSLRESIDQGLRKFCCCPICWDELGKNPLVSTKCGHVFCLKCLERSLCLEKKCPTCRNILKVISELYGQVLIHHCRHNGHAHNSKRSVTSHIHFLLRYID